MTSGELFFDNNSTTLDAYRLLSPNADGEFRVLSRHPRFPLLLQ